MSVTVYVTVHDDMRIVSLGQAAETRFQWVEEQSGTCLNRYRGDSFKKFVCEGKEREDQVVARQKLR